MRSILSIADIKASPLLGKDVLVIVSLSAYFALSVTNLHPLLVLCPLFASGIFLAVGTNAQNSFGHTPLDFTAKLIIVLFAASYAASVALSSDIAASINAMTALFPGILIAYILFHIPKIQLRGISWCLGQASQGSSTEWQLLVRQCHIHEPRMMILVYVRSTRTRAHGFLGPQRVSYFLM